MKRLQDFIIENVETTVDEAAKESKSITFNFKDLENAEDTLKSFEGKEYCTIDEDKLTIEVTPENFDKLDEVKESIKTYCDTIRKSQKVSSDEQYAQKTKSFEDNVNEFEETINAFANAKKTEEE